MPLLLIILVATLIAGIGSVWLAALAHRRMLDGYTQHLLSLAAGALLATAFVHLLPEAFESQAGARELFTTLLIGLVFFFLLDKAELWHHGHEHYHAEDHAGHDHGHGHHHAGGWAVLVGDSVHCFGDGVLIASAFVVDLGLGLSAALAVLAHEVPHHMGDLIVLGESNPQRAALLKVSLAGSVTSLGGLLGWWLVDHIQVAQPFFLVIASSSFVYVALADLIPQLQRRLNLEQTLVQVAWLMAGVIAVTVVGGLF